MWVARFVGLLGADAPAGEILGVGLASGLLVLTSWWAAIVSGGRSSFTPVAVGFALAIGLAAVRRWRRAPDVEPDAAAADDVDDAAPEPSQPGRFRHLAVAVLGGAVFVTAVALLYGATMAQSPRDGVQPLEFMDEAYYAVLGADLAKTGTESLYSPSGFTDIHGLPTQTWYHWGEAWLGADRDLAPRHGAARCPPLHRPAAAPARGGGPDRHARPADDRIDVARRSSCSGSPPACSSRPGAASRVGHDLRDHGCTAWRRWRSCCRCTPWPCWAAKPASWALAAFVGSAAAVILPAHIVIAVLAAVGVGSVWALRIGQSLLATRRLPAVAARLAAGLGWRPASRSSPRSAGAS